MYQTAVRFNWSGLKLPSFKGNQRPYRSNAASHLGAAVLDHVARSGRLAAAFGWTKPKASFIYERLGSTAAGHVDAALRWTKPKSVKWISKSIFDSSTCHLFVWKSDTTLQNSFKNVLTKEEITQILGTHIVPKGGQRGKKLSAFGAYIFGIGIPRGFRL